MKDPDVLPANIHRALLYVEALGSVGAWPLPEQLETFATSEVPRGVVYQSALEISMASRLAMARYKVADSEPVVEYLSRMGWTALVNERVHLTPLGASLLAGLRGDGRAVQSRSSEDVAITVLEPSDPFVYASATGGSLRLAQACSSIPISKRHPCRG